jgi:hypothetical protein
VSGSVPRDRDAAGRARNARPRDAAGRPLQHGAGGVERVPDELVLPPAEALSEAQRLLDAGQPFHAHEILEGTWKASPDPERALWQGLAQVCVGLTHLQRGNVRGAVALLTRGGERISAYAEHPPHAVDVRGVRETALQLADSLASGGEVQPVRLVLRSSGS